MSAHLQYRAMVYARSPNIALMEGLTPSQEHVFWQWVAFYQRTKKTEARYTEYPGRVWEENEMLTNVGIQP